MKTKRPATEDPTQAVDYDNLLPESGIDRNSWRVRFRLLRNDGLDNTVLAGPTDARWAESLQPRMMGD